MSRCLARALSALIAVLPLVAQQGRGTISGTVTDATGASVPAAIVRLVNTGTNASTQVATNEEGYFTAPALPVGIYNVSAEKTGFKRVTQSNITLQVDGRMALNLKMEVGATAE